MDNVDTVYQRTVQLSAGLSDDNTRNGEVTITIPKTLV